MYFKKFIPQKKKITYKDIAKSKFQTWTWPIWQYILDSTDSLGPRKSWSKNDTAWSLPWFLIFHTLPTLEAGKQASTAGNNQKQTPIVQNPSPKKWASYLEKQSNQTPLSNLSSRTMPSLSSCANPQSISLPRLNHHRHHKRIMIHPQPIHFFKIQLPVRIRKRENWWIWCFFCYCC